MSYGEPGTVTNVIRRDTPSDQSSTPTTNNRTSSGVKTLGRFLIVINRPGWTASASSISSGFKVRSTVTLPNRASSTVPLWTSQSARGSNCASSNKFSVCEDEYRPIRSTPNGPSYITDCRVDPPSWVIDTSLVMPLSSTIGSNGGAICPAA